MNVLKINLQYSDSVSNSIFGPKNKEMWDRFRRKAVGQGAFILKEKIRKQFVSELPGADRPLRSKNSDSGKRWLGKLKEIVQQGKVDSYPEQGIAETDVMLKGTRKSGHGDWIGIVYNKGSFKSPGRWGRKKRHATKGKKGNMQTNKYYRYRGNIKAYDYFEKGQQGFNFTATVDDILKRYIEQLK